MKLNIKFLGIFLFILLFGLFFTHSALAANYDLSGSVKDNSGNAITGATVDVYNPGTTTDVVPSVTTDSSGNYDFSSVPQGTYDVKVTPQTGSNYSPAIALSQTISANTVLNFILTTVGSVTLSGHIYDSSGSALANQRVVLTATNNAQTAITTDATGSYSLNVSPGNYGLIMSGNTTSLVSNLPQNYLIAFTTSAGGPFPISLTQDVILNVTIPAKQVTLHVQDASGNPVSGVAIAATQPGGGTKIIGNIDNFTMVNETSTYGSTSGPLTDASGNATVWLLPFDTYTFTATPPTGSNFSQTVLSNISISSDTQKTIVLQQSVTFSGHVYDASGSPVANQNVVLTATNNTQTKAITDSSGSYSLKVSPGRYGLFMSGSTSSLPSNIPQQYLIGFTTSLGGPFPVSLTQNTTLDVTIPAKQVTIHVQDAFGNPISNIAIAATQPGGGTQVLGSVGNFTLVNEGSTYGSTSGPLTDASGNATVWLLPFNTYSFTASPPSGSTYQSTTLSNISISSNTQETITLQQPVTLSGHVYDASGAPVANQNVVLTATNNTQTKAITDSSGSYTLSVSAGKVGLIMSGNTTSLVSNLPQNYLIAFTTSAGGPFPISLTQNTTLDVTIPAKKIIVHIQDASNKPVSGVAIAATQPGGGTQVLGSVGNFTLVNEGSTYGSTSGPLTDASGNATVWLLPFNTYSFTATPPNGSIYSTFILNNISVTGDQTELISLQYNHATPTTTATLTPVADSNGNYSDPTTITLSATAASGYTIANTYYTIDGGSQQTYSAPFTISGAGSHTITYWSVDNSGVPEAPNSKTFTIHADQPPAISPIPDKTLNEGDSYAQNGSFSDDDSTSWTATVDYGDGSGIQPLPINPDKTFTLSHNYLDEGTYTLTVVVQDEGGLSDLQHVAITVNNAPMTVSSITAPIDSQQVNTTVTATATFTDAGVLDTHTATVTWGDGHTTTCSSTPTSECTLIEPNGTTPGSITANHIYTSAGVNTITLTVTDDDGVQKSSPPFQYLVVYNPAAGFVTTSGKYISQPGWDLLNPSATGEVKFGVSSQYQTGSTTPTGNTKLMFKVDDLNFQSTSYSWMVVNNNLAYLFGTGTIANSPDIYTIFVAVDQTAQTIRFQLRNNTTQDIVYDTQPGVSTLTEPTTPLTQGSIKIH